MNTNLRKILIVLIIVLIIALIGFLVYNFFIKKPSGEEGIGPGELPEGEEGESGPGWEEGEEITPSPALKIKAISAERVLTPVLSSDEMKIAYYGQANGNIWQSAFDGSSLTRISSVSLDNLVKVIWSPDKNKIIRIYQDAEGSISKYFYNHETNQALPLSKDIKEITWSLDDNKIAYQYTNEITNKNTITIADPDGNNWKNILDVRIKNLNLDWISSGITFCEKPSGIAQSSIFLLNPSTGNLTKVLSNIYGMAAKWSPQADKILYSKTNNKGKNLALYLALKDGSGETSANISSLVEKCVWSADNRSLFCAIPKDISQAEVLPDDFYKGIFVSDDEFWKINLETGERTPLLEPWEKGEESYDAVNLFLSPLEDYLFFVNKKNGLLYSIEL